ncbi:hypothetical protein ACFZCG_39280 [Streptomyces tanashiensis]|uniref:hypothetical protein n=1 Tax=Streptomyces tanashiensis TaxID=67367 RepID=UPI0036E3AB03
MAGVLLSLTGTTPAFAEGSWTSYIQGWHAGDESRRWTDNNADAVSTSVGFSGCATDGASGFSHATVILWKDVFGPDENKGAKTNYCNRTSWGDVASGSYYFELDNFIYGYSLTVNSVGTQY